MIIACTGISDPGLVAEVKLLAVVAAQDVEEDGAGGVRIAQRVAPERVISTVDPDARHGHRSRRDRYDGYKLHVSVDVDSDLLVAGQATTATTGDGEILADLLEDDPVAVAEVIGDTHYGNAENRHSLAHDGVELTAPAQPSRGQEGILPAKTSSPSISRPEPSPARPGRPRPSRPARHGTAKPNVSKLESVCPLPAAGIVAPNEAGGRTIDINRDEELLIAARQARWTPQFRQRYRERSPSGTLSERPAQIGANEAALARDPHKPTPGSSFRERRP